MGSPASRCDFWGAVGSPCGRLRCIFAGVGPLCGPHIYASSFRGRASLTRGYRVVRPLWGRRPRGVLSAREVAIGGTPSWRPPRSDVASPRYAFTTVGRPGGVGRQDGVPPKVASSLRVGVLFPGRAGLCAIWQTVNADTRLAPPFSVGKAAQGGCPVAPSLGFWFPSHGSGDPSHGFSLPRLVSDGKLGPICAI